MADHGAEISLRIGQHVRHRDHAGQRVTGHVNSLQIESEKGLTATVLLDAPIIIPACDEGDREIRINWQTVPVTELSPFDERDEQIAELLALLRSTRQQLEVANDGLQIGGLLHDILLRDLDSALAKFAAVNHG